jgi:FkbM family methyltransferase
VLKNIALGDSDGMVQMQLQDDPLSTTSRIRSSREEPGKRGYAEVVASRGDSLVACDPGLMPDVIKIDVEGHEGAVVNGLRQLLPESRLRCIGIEVHFTVLEQRDEMHVPALLQRVLQEHGFHTRWTDSSHLVACR